MQRVLVTGLPCAGKSTLAKPLARALGGEHIEVDEYHYGPGWIVPPDFEQVIAAKTAAACWVADDFGASEVRDLLWERADTLVWLDPSRRVAQYRAIKRTLRRLLTREPLAGGNREGLRSWRGPDHPVRYVWDRHASTRREMEMRLADPRWQQLTIVRLQHRHQVRAFMRSLGQSSAS